MNEAELLAGATKSSSFSKTLHLIENFLSPITGREFTSEDAIAYAAVRSKLERAGTALCEPDGESTLTEF